MTKKKKKPVREPWLPTWTPQAHLLGFTVYDDRKLGLTIAGSNCEYFVIAIETPGTSPEEILDAHAHQSLGAYPTVHAAMSAAAKYAKKWWTAQSKKRRASPRCDCRGID